MRDGFAVAMESFGKLGVPRFGPRSHWLTITLERGLGLFPETSFNISFLYVSFLEIFN